MNSIFVYFLNASLVKLRIYFTGKKNLINFNKSDVFVNIIQIDKIVMKKNYNLKFIFKRKKEELF